MAELNRGGTETGTETTETILREDSVVSVVSVVSVTDIRNAIGGCLPEHESDLDSAIFRLARTLRALLPGAQVPSTEPHVEAWYQLARERIPSLEWTDVWWEFIRKWDFVKFPAGASPMDMIVKAVEESEPPECAKRYGGKVGSLVHVLQRLQMETGEKPFFISCRTAAALVGTTYPRAARWLKNLTREGVIEVDTKVKSNEYRARRYRYLGD